MGNKFEGRLKNLTVGLYGTDDKGKIGGIVCRFSSLYLSLDTRNNYKMISKRKIPSFNPHYHTLEMRPSLLFPESNSYLSGPGEVSNNFL